MDMDSFGKTPRFRYNPSPNQESDNSFSGTLQIYVHHARNIHNICIYDKQDVYAKFSLTYNPDETLTTKIIIAGGKNPDFNEHLILNINQPDCVLKCEIWMLSRAKNYMDDQLLGFVLVPISSVFNKGKVTQDFDLSSTDLFHSPAGTIKLSLTLTAKTPLTPPLDPVADSVVATSDLLLDKKIPEDYCRIEFPDINVVSENQQMVSEYFAKNGTILRPWLEKPDGSFLRLGAAPQVLVEDYEMGGNSPEEYQADSISPDGSIQNSGFLSSTTTSLSDERNSADSMDKTETWVLENKTGSHGENEKKVEISNDEGNKCSANLVRNVKLEEDESAMQQHIVDMYMKSMHQFTESLAKMKLPMGLDKNGSDDQGNVIQKHDDESEIDQQKKNKDNSRVFYGSRAFF